MELKSVTAMANTSETNENTNGPKGPYSKFHPQSRQATHANLSSICNLSNPQTTSFVSSQTSETCPLLWDSPRNAPSESDGEGYGDDASRAGRPRTIWWREIRSLLINSIPLIATLLLQYSINMISIFAAGRIGKVELAAVSRKF